MAQISVPLHVFTHRVYCVYILLVVSFPFTRAEYNNILVPVLQENLSFFCEACLGLGLRSSQLFNPEDLLVSGPTTHSPYRPRL